MTRSLGALVHSRAKAAATRDLIEMFRGQYEVLHGRYVEHFRAELGWTDQRPAANRRRAKGGDRRDDED